jgi:hypothetical protein
MYLNNRNAVDKCFCAVITGITYTIYMKLQKYNYYRREHHADPFALHILPNVPTSQIS